MMYNTDVTVGITISRGSFVFSQSRSSIRSDEGLTLESQLLNLFTVANLDCQLR